uniref:Peptidase S1 domain-containing protein n=1 Tax=Glossina brevipalpis TaxID=37001 RepID=A0A1A9W095_9MUSC
MTAKLIENHNLRYKQFMVSYNGFYTPCHAHDLLRITCWQQFSPIISNKTMFFKPSKIIYILSLSYLIICVKLISSIKIANILALERFEYNGNVTECTAIIIGNNVLLGNSLDIDTLADSSSVQYHLTSRAEHRKHVRIKKSVRYIGNSEEADISMMLVVTKRNLELDEENVAAIEIATKSFALNAVDCSVIVEDRLEVVKPLELNKCKEKLSKLKKGLLCLHYSHFAVNGFALICNDELVGLNHSTKTVVPNNPVTYIDIYEHRRWLKQNIEEHRLIFKSTSKGFPHEANPKMAVGESIDQELLSSSCVKAKPLMAWRRILTEYLSNLAGIAAVNGSYNKMGSQRTPKQVFVCLSSARRRKG